MARMVNCIKLGREAEALDVPPYPGELGKQFTTDSLRSPPSGVRSGAKLT